MPKLPPDPDRQNDDRAEWAHHAIAAFMGITGAELEDAVADLVADLHHWCDRNGQNLAEELARGEGHYATETTGRWMVYSPDGLLIQPEPFKSMKAVRAGLRKWLKRFELQGHYTTARGERLPLAELEVLCRIELLPVP